MLVDTVDLQSRDQIVWQEGLGIFNTLMRIQSACGFNAKELRDEDTMGINDMSHDGGIDPYISFAAASLQALILEVGSEAWDDPLGVAGEGEATTMFFARPDDPLPAHFQKREPIMIRLAQPYVEQGTYIDHVFVDEEPESLGSRHSRFISGIARIQGICDGLGIDKPALERVVSRMIDRIAAQSPVRDPREVKMAYRSTTRRSKRGRPKTASAAAVEADQIAA